MILINVCLEVRVCGRSWNRKGRGNRKERGDKGDPLLIDAAFCWTNDDGDGDGDGDRVVGKRGANAKAAEGPLVSLCTSPAIEHTHALHTSKIALARRDSSEGRAAHGTHVIRSIPFVSLSGPLNPDMCQR